MVLQNIDYANNKCSIHFLTVRKLEISSQVIVRWPSLVGIEVNPSLPWVWWN